MPNSGFQNFNAEQGAVQNNGLGGVPQSFRTRTALAICPRAARCSTTRPISWYQFAGLWYLHHGPSEQPLLSDGVVNYDPLSGAGTLSLITNEGVTGGGRDNPNRILDNSYEYRSSMSALSRLAGEISAAGAAATPAPATPTTVRLASTTWASPWMPSAPKSMMRCCTATF